MKNNEGNCMQPTNSIWKQFKFCDWIELNSNSIIIQLKRNGVKFGAKCIENLLMTIVLKMKLWEY
jgi:hypothetical protein